MDGLPVYILAGGKSKRFGRDKARARVKGQALVVHAASSLASIAASLAVVGATADAYADLGLRTIGDRYPGLGPLAGLEAALGDLAEEGWLCLSSCDLMGVEPRWVESLCARREDGARAVAFRGDAWEPFPALYHTGLRAEIGRRIEAGQLALWRLLERECTAPLPLPSDWARAIQVNTPGGLRRYRKSLSSPLGGSSSCV